MSNNPTPSSSVNWRNPSAAHMQKYDLRPLPDDFEPTEEEKALLEMYEIVRNTERVAARLKEEAARNKLNAKNEEFKKSTASKKKRRKLKEKKKPSVLKTRESDDDGSVDEEDLDDDDVEDNDDDESSEDEDDIYERNEAKLEKMREEIEEAKQQHQQKEKDDFRAELLATTTDDGLSIRRKRPIDAVNEPAPSLIANLTAAATPPHDFSRKLELEDSTGKVLFPVSQNEFTWSPPEGVFSPNDGAFTAELEDFDVARAQAGVGNNTLAIKLMAPSDSRRFSVNITGQGHNNYDSILFHFNPRQREKGGQLVINDKQEGSWGQAISIPLSQIPLMFGQTSSTLLIQITGDGFDIFVEGKHCARLEHRKELPTGRHNLVLQFPSTDDYGSPENWVVYKVWWGNRPIIAKGDVSGVPGVNSYNSLHPRKLFISGLTKIYKEAEVDVRRAELERAFQKFAGARGAHVIVPTKSTFAFVEFESERQADMALSEMSQKYRLNRARRSKHEALQEERAAREAAKLGTAKKTDSDWG